jgi:hypothetical protein
MLALLARQDGQPFHIVPADSVYELLVIGLEVVVLILLHLRY